MARLPTNSRNDSRPTTVIHGDGFDEKRRNILAGAARVFDRKGFAAGTTKEVAAEVGLSQPAIYHYVGSKEDLLSEIAQQVASDMLTALRIGMSQSSNVRDQFRSVIREFTAAVLRNQVEFSVFWKELNFFPPNVREKVQREERQFIKELTVLVAALQDSGDLPEEPPRAVITEGILGMICWTYHWYRPGKSLDPSALAETFLALIGLSDHSAAFD